MRDTGSSSEDDAGRFERAQAYEVDDREHDGPGVPVERSHDCGDDPECRDLLCILNRVVNDQKSSRARA